MRLDDDFADGRFFLGRETQLVERQKDFAARQQTERHALPIYRRHGGNADINFFTFNPDVDAAVLRKTLFRDVHSRHDFDTRNDGSLIALKLRGHRRLVKNAIDAITNPQLVFGRLEMNICGAIFVGFPNDLVNELDNAGFLIALGNFFVFADEQFKRFVFGDLAECLSADAIEFLERLFDFLFRRERKLHRTMGVELHRRQK